MRQHHEARQRAYHFDAPANTGQRMRQGTTLSLAEAAQVTGIAPDTICAWEETEHLFTNDGRRTGQRRYGAETVQRLLTIQKLLGQGMTMQHIHTVMDELAHAVARARLDAPLPQPHPLATTQKFLAVLRQVDAEIFAQLVALSHDAASTPNDTLDMIQRELEIVQPTFGAHRLLFWLRLPDGSWPSAETSLSASQQQTFARHATAAIRLGKVITRKLSQGDALTIAPVSLDASHHSVLMIVRSAEQALDKSEQAALEYIAQRLTQFYHAARCWMNDRREWGFLRQLVNVLPQPIIMRDTTGKVVFFNESAVALAQNAADIRAARANHLPLPTPYWDSAFPDGTRLHGDDVPGIQALSTGEVVRDVPMKIKTSDEAEDDQATFWPGLATAVPLFEADGTLACSATILQDMTTPKKIEHMKDNMLDRVRHQVGNGLTPVRGYAQVVERLCQQGLTAHDAQSCHHLFATIISHMQVIKERTFVMDSWLDELRDLEKTVLGKPESCSLTRLVENGIHEMRRLHPDYHFTYEFDSGDTELAGQWVPSDIRFIIDNLLSNAVKYSPPGSTINVFLSLAVLEDEPAAQMIVRDQGFGIPPDTYGYIFEKGKRLYHKDANGEVIPGTGEGLALCQTYAARYRGHIFPRPSKTGPGTEFWVKLQLEP